MALHLHWYWKLGSWTGGSFPSCGSSYVALSLMSGIGLQRPNQSLHLYFRRTYWLIYLSSILVIVCLTWGFQSSFSSNLSPKSMVWIDCSLLWVRWGSWKGFLVKWMIWVLEMFITNSHLDEQWTKVSSIVWRLRMLKFVLKLRYMLWNQQNFEHGEIGHIRTVFIIKRHEMWFHNRKLLVRNVRCYLCWKWLVLKKFIVPHCVAGFLCI